MVLLIWTLLLSFVYVSAPSTFLDVHVTADHPEEIISTIIDALKDDMGNSHKARITFQFESIPTAHEVIETATLIRASGEISALFFLFYVSMYLINTPRLSRIFMRGEYLS